MNVPTGGTSEIITLNYTGDGSTKIFEFGNNLNDLNALFVKIDKILQNNSVYTHLILQIILLNL